MTIVLCIVVVLILIVGVDHSIVVRFDAVYALIGEYALIGDVFCSHLLWLWLWLCFVICFTVITFVVVVFDQF